ncbi:MAG: S9 family peptidase [Aggregatilineales bacterium]
MSQILKQFGTWSSSVQSSHIASEKRFYDVQCTADGETVVWVETRGKHSALVMQTGVDSPRDLTNLSVRGRVGYGGGEFALYDNQVIFSTGERLYRLSLERGVSHPIINAFGGFASPKVSPDGRWVIYVHTYEGQDGLGIVDFHGELWGRKLAFGTDFVMQPTWHPASTHVAYIAWDHPNMPWDKTQLRLLTLAMDGTGVPYASEHEILCSGASYYQPEFSPDGNYLTYVSDEKGFGQLYLYDLQSHETRQLTGIGSGVESEQLYHKQVKVPPEIGKPAWVQGGRVYGWCSDSKALYFLRNQQGFISLWHLDLDSGTTSKVDGLDEYTFLDQISVATSGTLAIIASSTRIPARVITYTPQSELTDNEPAQNAKPRIHARATMEMVAFDELAEAKPLIWQGDDGDPVYGLYYAPLNARYEGSGAPPVIIDVHSGPTAQTRAEYDGRTQFFATRGFGVLHVNYRGSTGYGRAYRNKLQGNWGVYDVEDAASGAKYLIEQGLADPTKLIILGSSAGGFTVLQSLVTKPGYYKAGVCMYGVANQFMLVQDTHKFEERYTDSLIGTLPEDAALYRERSPFFNVSKIRDPLILFQGTEDAVVPKNQSDSLVASLRTRGVPHEYHVYEGEGHGFRKPETYEHFYKAVMDFLMQYVIYA